MDPHKPPANVSGVPGVAKLGPPEAVKWAVWCNAVIAVTGLCVIIFVKMCGSSLEYDGTSPWRVWVAFIGFEVVSGLMCLALRGLYQGKRWAYALYVACVLYMLWLDPILAQRGFSSPTDQGKQLFGGLRILDLISVVMLLLPVARRRFFRKR